jgi:NAD(P)-dependent dehydrogenase (short-subunit alcohol dehydrogenase family)
MEVKSFGIRSTNIAPGDFATNIASSRYHAPVIKDSPVKNWRIVTTMDAHVDSGSNPNEMAEAVWYY